METPELQKKLAELQTRNKQLQEDLQDYEGMLIEFKRIIEHFELLFSSLPIMVWHKDTQNRHIRVNDAAAALEGTVPENINGKTAEELYPPEQAAAYYADDLEVINSGKPKMNIVEKHTPVGTGEDMWLLTGKVPVFDRNQAIVGVIVFATDITEQKRTEARLLKALEEK